MMHDEEKKIQGLGGGKGRAEVRKSGRAEEQKKQSVKSA
jgi:hypothetical protein